jgi:hypothetical protein
MRFKAAKLVGQAITIHLFTLEELTIIMLQELGKIPFNFSLLVIQFTCNKGAWREAPANKSAEEANQDREPLLSFISVTVFPRRIFFRKFPDWFDHIRRSADLSAPTAAQRLQASSRD